MKWGLTWILPATVLVVDSQFFEVEAHIKCLLFLEDLVNCDFTAGSHPGLIS